jgi:very-short-patch-repair endonuclease
MFSNADHVLAQIAGGSDNIFTIDDARNAGLTAAQIDLRARRIWRRLHRGVYSLPGAAPDWRGLLRAAVLAGGPGACASHRSAAALYEVPGACRELTEITCVRWRRARRANLVVHEQRRLPDVDVTKIDGIAVVTAELLVLQLAWWRPAFRYIEAVVHALRRKRLISHSSMSATFERHARRGFRGVRVTRAVLEQWDPSQRPTESEMETLLLQTLRAHGLPEPVTQYVVRDDAGDFVARADAALPDWRIVIEYQSSQEHLDEFQAARDDRRRNRLLAAGYYPLMARADDLRDRGRQLVAQIRAIQRRVDAQQAATPYWRHQPGLTAGN